MNFDTVIKKLVSASNETDKDHFETIKQLLELKTSLNEKELNSLLLQKLIEKYAIVEKMLKNANHELAQKNEQVLEALKERDIAFSRLEIEQKRTKELADLLKKMFGRYLSPEVMNSIIKDPSALELGGEKRQVTLMMTDLRGFTALCERLAPEQVVKMLNGYCEIMMEVIDKYHGTLNEILGDSLLVVFGAPKDLPDRAEQAVACALEMQNAMIHVNHNNQLNGFPELEMGIGLNETEVIVGNIGSDKRSKYAVVGSGVNLTSRIESYTVGGQIMVSESIYDKVGHLLDIDAPLDINPKGTDTPIRIYEVNGIAGTWNIALNKNSSPRIDIAEPIEIECRQIENKIVQKKVVKGFMIQVSENDSQITFPFKIDDFTNLQINLKVRDSNLRSTKFYGKVIRTTDEKRMMHTVRFTMLPFEIKTFLKTLQTNLIV